MRTVAVIQCRFGSSRLYGKALLKLSGRPMLAHVIERARAIPGVHGLMMATTTTDRDDAVANVAAQHDVPFWRGSEPDVLGRFRQAAELAKADVVMRITGDCPLLCPDVAQMVLDAYLAGPRDGYAWNDTARSGWPDGQDVEVFSMQLLARTEQATRIDTSVRRDVQKERDREHVTPAMRGDDRRPALARRVTVVPCPLQLSRLKLSVDSPKDYERAMLLSRYVGGDLSWPALVKACVKAGLATREEVGA